MIKWYWHRSSIYGLGIEYWRARSVTNKCLETITHNIEIRIWTLKIIISLSPRN